MTAIKKTSIILSILFIFSFILGDFAFAQRPLEIDYPEVEGVKLETTSAGLPSYVNYIFNFAIGIGGLIAFLALVYGGIRYLTSAGNPSAMSDANNQIFSALLGLIVLLGSWLLLTTINPQLIVINPQLTPSELVVGETAGVYLCKDASGDIAKIDQCRLFTQSAPKLQDFDNKAGYIKFQNPKDFQYGAVLHQDHDYMGRCRVCLEEGCDIGYVNDVSSVTVFAQAPSGEGPGVTFYEMDNFNEKGWHTKPIASANPYLNYNNLGLPPDVEVYRGRSIKIENDGKYLVALYSSENMNDRCEIFTNSDPGLVTNYVCKAPLSSGCFKSATILPIKNKF